MENWAKTVTTEPQDNKPKACDLKTNKHTQPYYNHELTTQGSPCCKEDPLNGQTKEGSSIKRLPMLFLLLPSSFCCSKEKPSLKTSPPF
jgi:hypothetical protein